MKQGTVFLKKVISVTFWGTARLFAKAAAPFYSPTISEWGLKFLRIFASTWVSVFLIICTRSRVSFQEQKQLKDVLSVLIVRFACSLELDVIKLGFDMTKLLPKAVHIR